MAKTQACGYRANDQKGYARSKRDNRVSPECGALIFAVLSVMESVNQGLAGGRHEDNSSAAAGITIRLYNQPHVPQETLHGAEHDVVKLFRLASVNPSFVDCPITRERGPDYLACQAAAGSGFVVKIIAVGAAKHLPASSHAFGLAGDCGPREATCTAYIFYDRVRELAPDAHVDPAVVLGRVMLGLDGNNPVLRHIRQRGFSLGWVGASGAT